MSPINLKFLRHSDFEYSRIRETGGGMRHFISILSNTSILWPLGGAATIRVRCWCFAPCKDSGVQCIIVILAIAERNCANMENTLFAKVTRKPCCRRESSRCRCNFRSIDQDMINKDQWRTDFKLSYVTYLLNL